MAEAKVTNDDAVADVDKEIAKLRKDVEKLTALLRDITSNAAGIAKETLRDRAGHASDQIHAAVDSTTKTMRRTVHEHPVTTVAMALGLGFLLGQILRR